jgi:hypothetical protein
LNTFPCEANNTTGNVMLLLSTRCHVTYIKFIHLKLITVITELGARCWWRSWLRHCVTSRKVAGSIPDGVNEIFHWHNTSGRTVALGLTQPLTEMSTTNISWG